MIVVIIVLAGAAAYFAVSSSSASTSTAVSTATSISTSLLTTTVTASTAQNTSQLQEVKATIGYQPLSIAAGLTENIRTSGVWEQRAAAYGYKLDAKWTPYASAIPIFQQMNAGTLDFGVAGSFAMMLQMAKNASFTPLFNTNYYTPFLVARTGSPIHDFNDLKGKTIAVPIGTSGQFAFQVFLQAQFGTSNPTDLGMKIVNFYGPYFPAGVDVVQGDWSIVTKLMQSGQGQPLADIQHGYTASYYNGTLGQGAGIRIPSVKNSSYYPFGYSAESAQFVVQTNFLKQYPKLVQALAEAAQIVERSSRNMTLAQWTAVSGSYWGLGANATATYVNLDPIYQRGFVWPTRTEAHDYVAEMDFILAAKLATPSALSLQKVRAYWALSAPILQAAYNAVQDPAPTAFNATQTDLRGAPIWQDAAWQGLS